MSKKSKKAGICYLVGAGPGDPGLLTVKAKSLIENADVIVYDYLANEEFLSYAKPKARIIYVGKKGGKHTLPQHKINDLIVKLTQSGKDIVRLKGGDPFIFGRGGEEAEELVDAGVKFEVVPGVTSAVSAPAYAGIPLTHREHTSDVSFITGHEDPTKDSTSINWEKISTATGTLVFLMGIKRLEFNVKKLIENGLKPKTPAALIRWGTRPEQFTITGTLENIAEKAKAADLKPPAIFLVGSVVKLRDKLNWFESKPLFGKRIVVTRTREQASRLAEILKQKGAQVIEIPTIEIVPIKKNTALKRSLSSIGRYDWVVFTSVNGVKHFLDGLRENGKDIRILHGKKLAAIGPATAKALEDLGLIVDLVPDEYRAEGLISKLGKRAVKGKSFLIPRAEEAREILPEAIKEAGGKVKVVPVYRAVKPKDGAKRLKNLVENGNIDMVTFASSSTVANFIGMLGKKNLPKFVKGVKVACIGPITAKTAEEKGLKIDVMPKKYTIPEMAQAILSFYEGKGKNKNY